MVIIAEGVPISDVRRLIASAKAKGKVVIGPATVGGIQAGSFKIGEFPSAWWHVWLLSFLPPLGQNDRWLLRMGGI